MLFTQNKENSHAFMNAQIYFWPLKWEINVIAVSNERSAISEFLMVTLKPIKLMSLFPTVLILVFGRIILGNIAELICILLTRNSGSGLKSGLLERLFRHTFSLYS